MKIETRKCRRTSTWHSARRDFNLEINSLLRAINDLNRFVFEMMSPPPLHMTWHIAGEKMISCRPRNCVVALQPNLEDLFGDLADAMKKKSFFILCD